MKLLAKLNTLIIVAAAIVGIIVGFLQLYNYFFKKDYKANVTAEKFTYQTCPIFLELAEREQDYFTTIDGSIRSTSSWFNQDEKYAIDSLMSTNHFIEDILDIYCKNIPVDKQFLYADNYDVMFEINIENIGNKPLDSIKIELPDIEHGFFETILPDNKTISGFFSSSLYIGSITPSYTTKTRIWCGYNSEYFFKNSRVTHKFGSFEVYFIKKYKGLIDWIIDGSILRVFIVLFIATYVLGNVLYYLHGLRNKYLLQKGENDAS